MFTCLFTCWLVCLLVCLPVAWCVWGRVPLVVELWHRGSSSRDQLIGRASILLSHLLSSSRTRAVGPSGEQSWKQTHQDQIPVVHLQRYVAAEDCLHTHLQQVEQVCLFPPGAQRR